jgi:acetyl esterase/lipase
MFEEIVTHSEKRLLSVDEFVRKKYHEMPDYERKDFMNSRNVKNWTAKWYAEYVKVQKHVSVRSFQNRVSELRKAERERLKKEVADLILQHADKLRGQFETKTDEVESAE